MHLFGRQTRRNALGVNDRHEQVLSAPRPPFAIGNRHARSPLTSPSSLTADRHACKNRWVVRVAINVDSTDALAPTMHLFVQAANVSVELQNHHSPRIKAMTDVALIWDGINTLQHLSLVHYYYEEACCQQDAVKIVVYRHRIFSVNRVEAIHAFVEYGRYSVTRTNIIYWQVWELSLIHISEPTRPY